MIDPNNLRAVASGVVSELTSDAARNGSEITSPFVEKTRQMVTHLLGENISEFILFEKYSDSQQAQKDFVQAFESKVKPTAIELKSLVKLLDQLHILNASSQATPEKNATVPIATQADYQNLQQIHDANTRNQGSTTQEFLSKYPIIWIGLFALAVSIIWWILSYEVLTSDSSSSISDSAHCLYSNDLGCQIGGSSSDSPIPIGYNPTLFWIASFTTFVGLFQKPKMLLYLLLFVFVSLLIWGAGYSTWMLQDS